MDGFLFAPLTAREALLPRIREEGAAVHVVGSVLDCSRAEEAARY